MSFFAGYLQAKIFETVPRKEVYEEMRLLRTEEYFESMKNSY